MNIMGYMQGNKSNNSILDSKSIFDNLFKFDSSEITIKVKSLITK